MALSAVMIAGFAVPAQAADAHSIIVAKTGSGAAQVTTTQSVGSLSIGVGRSKGSALSSFAQTTPTSVRMMATINDASQSSVNYPLGLPAGAGLTPQPDGSLVISRDLAGPTLATGIQAAEQFGTIAAPWAVDSHGTALPTSYSYTNGVLTQKVDTTGAAFPVVADPWVTFGWFEYVHFSRTETLNLYHAWQVSGTPVEMRNLCGLFALLGPEGIVAGIACYAYVTLVIQDINTTLWAAAHAYHERLVIKLWLGSLAYAGSTTEYAP